MLSFFYYLIFKHSFLLLLKNIPYFCILMIRFIHKRKFNIAISHSIPFIYFVFWLYSNFSSNWYFLIFKSAFSFFLFKFHIIFLCMDGCVNVYEYMNIFIHLFTFIYEYIRLFINRVIPMFCHPQVNMIQLVKRLHATFWHMFISSGWKQGHLWVTDLDAYLHKIWLGLWIY